MILESVLLFSCPRSEGCHTVDVLSPFRPVSLSSVIHGDSCPRLDVVHSSVLQPKICHEASTRVTGKWVQLINASAYRPLSAFKTKEINDTIKASSR